MTTQHLNREVEAAVAENVGVKPAGWLPIETAPKDGTRVLLFMRRRDESAIDIGHWLVWSANMKRAGHKDGWVHYVVGQPTHWMPLPPPPANPENPSP